MNALPDLKNYFTSDQRNLLLNSVIKSQLIYCSLIWMFTSRYLNNALNNIYKRSLRLIYNNHEKLLNRILPGNNLKTINKKTLNFFQLKYKNLKMVNDIFFSRQNIYNL